MPSPQRMPSRERRISEIKPDDIRVSLIGTVVDFDTGIVVLDDGTGKVNVTFEESPELSRGQVVRVLGRVIPLEEGVEIQGESCQDFTGLDKKTWDRVSALWEKSLGEL